MESTSMKFYVLVLQEIGYDKSEAEIVGVYSSSAAAKAAAEKDCDEVTTSWNHNRLTGCCVFTLEGGLEMRFEHYWEIVECELDVTNE